MDRKVVKHAPNYIVEDKIVSGDEIVSGDSSFAVRSKRTD